MLATKIDNIDNKKQLQLLSNVHWHECHGTLGALNRLFEFFCFSGWSGCTAYIFSDLKKRVRRTSLKLSGIFSKSHRVKITQCIHI